MRRIILWGAVLASVFMGIFSGLSFAQSAGISDLIDIPYQKFVLPNGLTLIVHEDHKAPVIALNIWYRVGSKSEQPGKTGFAHLFEHLMFNGSENYNDEYFKPFRKVGGYVNGMTTPDGTVYLERVTSSALDLVLWMESDRMGHLKGAISQAKLDEQRGVVQNELRQRLNQPLGFVEELIAKRVYPAGHPYSWTPGGSIEDVDNAKLEDVRKWFETYYGPNNAVVCIAGDIDAKTALEKVTKYFGEIPPLPPLSKHNVWIAKRSGVQRETVQDRVFQSSIHMIWNIPQRNSDEGILLNFAGAILSGGKSSRLYKRLVFDDQIATSVSANAQLNEMGGTFRITATANPDVPLEKVEKAVNEELSRFIMEGPTPEELERMKAELHVGIFRRLESALDKAGFLIEGEVYTGRPDDYKSYLRLADGATAESIKAAASKWLSDGVYILEVHPYPQLSVQKSDVDRKSLPSVAPAPEAKFPAIQRVTLSNGLKVVLVERHTVPMVNFILNLDAGFEVDPPGLSGVAGLTMSMLSEGTQRRTSLEIDKEKARLGVELSINSIMHVTRFSLSALKAKLDPALDLFADIIINPAFREADLQRTKNLVLTQIRFARNEPVLTAFRLFPVLLFGKNHPYGLPWSGAGTEDTVSKIARDNLVEFHKTWFRPNNATLIVVGDTSLAEMTPKLEKLFQGWKAGKSPVKNIPAVPLQGKQRIYLIDKPGALQSTVMAATLAPPLSPNDEIAVGIMNFILGGDFSSRLNMNIREDKHWSYGVNSSVFPGFKISVQRPFWITVPVQADKTKETMLEIQKEIEGVLGKKPITNNELNNVVSGRIQQSSAGWETLQSLLFEVLGMVEKNLPDDFVQKYPALLKDLTPDRLTEAAKMVIHPESLTWLVFGDVAKIEAKIRELGFGEVFIIDAEGNPVKPK